MNATFIRKQYLVSKLKFFCLLFFSLFLLCYLCLYLCLLCFFYYFSFAVLTVIGTIKRQIGHYESLFPLVTHNITFALFRNLYFRKTHISFAALLSYMIKCNYRLHKTNRSYMEFAFFKFFEKDFCT